MDIHLLERLKDIVRSAGTTVRSAQDAAMGIREKSSHVDLVTLYDPMVQEFLRSRLMALLPEAGFLGEEDATHDIAGKRQLFIVDRDALFSYHKLSEAFLQRVWSLYVASHYKNSPDDLQLLSDAPAHRLFVLLGPVREDQPLPDVYCVVQVCLEGRIGKETVRRELSKGTRSAGDLIPWIVAQQFLDSDFSQLSGARIVRIATHPDVQGMGYGRRALQQLQDYFQGRVQWSGEEEAPLEEEAPQGLDAEAKPRKHLPPLLVSLADRKPERLHVGVRES